ncbi:Carbonic anhydrase-related protein [Echinococcus granulosus]|uniref:Carbonic anhydrase-related protein n=1 Tax=Echinococcus granulosus TaxID=6210 RepID=W6UMX3_ECHGR|nr:Carbonic anhydrase-related protein [Echinococcus granulosus]EUB59482.1 Carbonic anhydrase-related protein [Echinococcus granulosus]
MTVSSYAPDTIRGLGGEVARGGEEHPGPRKGRIRIGIASFGDSIYDSIINSNKFHLKGIELQALFPAIDEYMTYEGSLPFPSCAETVTWIILNRSIQISLKEMKVLRQLRTDKTLWSTSMADNFRPVNPLNNRSVRTNIRFADSESVCEYRPSVSYFDLVYDRTALNRKIYLLPSEPYPVPRPTKLY